MNQVWSSIRQLADESQTWGTARRTWREIPAGTRYPKLLFRGVEMQTAMLPADAGIGRNDAEALGRTGESANFVIPPIPGSRRQQIPTGAAEELAAHIKNEYQIGRAHV